MFSGFSAAAGELAHDTQKGHDGDDWFHAQASSGLGPPCPAGRLGSRCGSLKRHKGFDSRHDDGDASSRFGTLGSDHALPPSRLFFRLWDDRIEPFSSQTTRLSQSVSQAGWLAGSGR